MTTEISKSFEALPVTLTGGAFLFNQSSSFTVYVELGRYVRSDGGPITTIYATSGSSRWPRLTLTYVLTLDPDEVATKYAELEAQGRHFTCLNCGNGQIQPPIEPGDTYRCRHCGEIVELANVRGSIMADAYLTHLRQASSY